MDSEVIRIGSGDLGGPGRPDPSACAALALRLLGEAAHPLQMSSLSLDIAAARLAAGSHAEIRTRVDKRTFAVAFTTLEAWSDGALVFSARALFTSAG